MSADWETWLAAHGRLWYDDRWYRIAWIALPQAIGLLLFATLWLVGPADRGLVPWAQPNFEKTAVPPLAVAVPAQRQSAPPLADKAFDLLAACKGLNRELVIQSCTALLTSGSLKGNDLATAYGLRGVTYSALRRYREAIDDMTQAITLNPRDFRFYYDRALVWINSGDHNRALQDLDQAIVIDGNEPLSHLIRGATLWDLKRPDDALAAISKAISLNPNFLQAYLNRAFLYASRHDWSASFADGSKIIELKPNESKGYEFRGQAYYEMGQYQAAVNDFTKAIDINSGVAWDWKMRGFANYRLNQSDAALADLLKARQLDATDHSIDPVIDELKAKQGGQQANDALAPCRSQDPVQIIQACGALLASGNLKGGDLALAYAIRGWAYHATKQNQLAMSDFNQAVALDPRRAEVFQNRADVWRELGEYEHALRDYDESIRLDPNVALAHTARGLTLVKLKRADEGLTEYDKAVKLDPKLWPAYRQRGLLYFDRGDWFAVISDAEKVIELKPGLEQGYELRGAAYFGMGNMKLGGWDSRLASAIDDFTKAISINSRAIYSLRSRGRAYYLLNRFDNAMSDYQAALRIDANDSETINYMNELKRALRRR